MGGGGCLFLDPVLEGKTKWNGGGGGAIDKVIYIPRNAGSSSISQQLQSGATLLLLSVSHG